MTLPGPRGGVQGVAFSPDGTRVALTGQEVVELWDLGTSRPVRTFRGHVEVVGGVAFSPDGQRLATAGAFDDTVRLWDVATGAATLVLRGPSGGIYGVAFSPDGRSVAASSDDRSVRLWDATTGAELARFRGHTSFVNGVAFSPDGRRIASACNDGIVKVWDVRRSHEAVFWSSAPSSKVIGVAFSPDGQSLATSLDGTNLSLWDPATGSLIRAVPESCRGLAYSPDGRRLATAGPGPLVTLRDAATGLGVRTLSGHCGDVWRVAYSPDGRRIASAGEDGSVRLWDAATGREVSTLSGHVFRVTGLAFSPDGARIAAASDVSELTVWDLASGRALFSRHRPMYNVVDVGHSVAFSPDGTRIAWIKNAAVEICDAATGREVLTLRGHTARVLSVTFSPDGTRIATASRDRTIKLWDARTGEEVFALRGHSGSVACLAFSPDGRRIASGELTTNATHLWDATPLPADRIEALPERVPGPVALPPAAPVVDPRFQQALENRNQELALLLINAPEHRPGDTARAIALARSGVEMEPGNGSCWLTLGRAHESAGDWPAATIAFLEAVELSPGDAMLQNDVAWILATRPDPRFRDPIRAVESARRAVAAAPKGGSFWNTLGVAHYRAGDWQAAIEALRKSMELRNGGDGLDWFFLAMAHRQRGEKERARPWYDKAVTWMEKHRPKDPELLRFRSEADELFGVEGQARLEAKQGRD
jgi:WD40 repeat protein/Flp pilus assembly protein TadD